LENLIEAKNSTLQKDKEEYEEQSIKKKNKSEKLKKNVLLLKLFQRSIMEKQLILVNQNLLNLMNLQEETLKSGF